MSKFLSGRYSGFESYVPGEQPKDMKYIKLNTNESPFPPLESVVKAAAEQAGLSNLYSDPECMELRKAAAQVFDVDYRCILPVNGSDEILNFAFMAFCDKDTPIAYPAISYGFYPVLAGLHGIPAIEIPLKDDLSIDCGDYIGLNKNIVIANPNAPTGLVLSPSEIEKIVVSNPDNLVIIDEAYVEFGAESVIGLTKKYKNLLVTRTFSKSHSLAGARLGFGIADPELIDDLNIIKYSTNPYNVNRMTAAAGVAALEENCHYLTNCAIIARNREYAAEKLLKLGFTLTESKANFLFAKSSKISGGELYKKLRERGILVRHFDRADISDYNRITVGTREQMDALVEAIASILT
ncbi:MAG: histidinol-phosphate transaminase [Oscillospiraceae bacterium]